MTQPEALLKFFNEFRTYAITYTYGPEWVHELVRSADGTDRSPGWDRYVAIVGQPFR